MGWAVVADRTASWLSNVTARGVESTLASASVLRRERTAMTPSAFRKNVEGLNPSLVFTKSPGVPGVRMPLSKPDCAGVGGVPEKLNTFVPTVVTEGGTAGVPADGGVKYPEPLPKLTCWLARVPDQSIPLEVVGFLESSTNLASMSTSLVGKSRRATNSSTAMISFSVATRTN